MNQRRLRSEEIYDAAADDESLAALPARLAEAFDARSTLINWICRDGSDLVVAHSGYFSDAQLALYAEKFIGLDPWVKAAAHSQPVNVATNLEEFVPVQAFARSAFYNEYIRELGDDTGRCMGMRVETRWGSGFIALQRGIGQPTFEPEAVAALGAVAPHLGRMLSMRGRLSSAARSCSNASGLADAVGQAMLLVTGNAGLLHANLAAEEMLRSGDPLLLKDGLVKAASSAADCTFRGAVARAASVSGVTAEALTLPLQDGGRLEVSLLPMPAASGPRRVLVAALAPARKDATLEQRLRALYGLSPAEAHLAVMLADGAAVAEMAAERRTTEGTVRLQLKRVMEKLDCRRQTDVVRIVRSLPLFHNGNGG